jgi:hypothetical protein
MAARLFVVIVLFVLSTGSAFADTPGLADVKAQKAAVKCQKAIDQAGAKLVAATLKNLDACTTAVLACVQTKPGDHRPGR